MASIVEKRLSDGSRAWLVRFRTPDGQQRSKQFKRKRDADACASVIEVDRKDDEGVAIIHAMRARPKFLKGWWTR